jgi:hypothetical protein
MISHKAVGVNLPAGFLTSFGQRFEKVLSVHVINKDVLSSISPIHDVVNGTGILDS